MLVRNTASLNEKKIQRYNCPWYRIFDVLFLNSVELKTPSYKSTQRVHRRIAREVLKMNSRIWHAIVMVRTYCEWTEWTHRMFLFFLSNVCSTNTNSGERMNFHKEEKVEKCCGTYSCVLLRCIIWNCCFQLNMRRLLFWFYFLNNGFESKFKYFRIYF